MNPARRALLLAGASWPLTGGAAPPPFPELRDVPFVPTPMAVVDRMLDMSGAKPGDYLVDLGCGDGRIVTEAARRGVRALGVDLDPDLIALCRRRTRDMGLEKLASFVQQDIYQTDLTTASIVTLYLLPEHNLKLKDKLARELRNGARVVSHDWDMGDWVPDARQQLYVPDKPVAGDDVSRLYLWVMPPRIRSR